MEQGGGGNISKKTAFMIGGGILLLGVGFFVYKKIKAKRKYGMGDKDRYSSSSSGGNSSSGSSSSGSSSSGSSSSSFDPSYASGQIYKAMKGWGTDEDLFFQTAKNLSKSERDEVKQHFETNYGDLKDWIEGDFSGSAEDDALSLFGY